MFWKTIEKSIDDLIYKDASYSFLVGSGISLDAPSNLPTGYQFTQSLLEYILPKEYAKTILELTNPNRKDTKAQGHFLRFEQLMGFLQESIDPDLHVLDVYAECNQPNFNHLFLAAMIKKGYPVFTTNFDGLIECGLISLGIKKREITPVINRKTWERNKIEGLPVYKLHGSLIDASSGADIRSSIQATIEQIVRGKKGDIFVLEKWKMEKLRQVLQERDLVILGYSGLDDFDIIPTVKTIKSQKRLIWVSHTENLKFNNAIIECLSDKNKILDFNVTSGMEKQSEQLLINVARGGTRNSYSIFRVRVNTLSLLAHLWKKWSVPFKYPINLESKSINQSYKTKIKTLNINDAFRWFLLGKVWYALGYLEQAMNAYKQSLATNKKLNDFKVKAMTLENIGSILETQGKLDEALIYLEQALSIDKRLNNLLGKAVRLNKIGFILYGQGKFDKSEDHYKHALVIFNKLKNIRGKASSLQGIGTLSIGQGKIDEALGCLKQALAIDEHLGDISGKATRLTSIGFIFKEQGKFDKAMKCYNQALDINEQLGDLLGKLTLFNNIGNIFNVQGEYVEALNYFKRTLALSEQLGDMNMKANVLGNIGNVFYRQGEFNKALSYYKQSYTIFKEYGYDYQAFLVMRDINIIENAISRKFFND